MNLEAQSTSPSVSQPQISDDDLLTICEFANVIACKCPAYLAALLRSVRKFRHYTTDCIQQFPEDTATHEWLSQHALEIEATLSLLVYELLQREQLLTDQQQLDIEALAERSYIVALQQSQPPS